MMKTKSLVLSATLLLSPLSGANDHLNPSPNMNPTTRHRATATVTVQHSDTTVYDELASPVLKELALQEVFTGEINGESSVRALQIFYGKGSARMTSVQRVKGTLANRKGTFVLQGSEVIESGKIKATWFVVPDTGTEELTGLRGEGGFEGDFGKGSTAYLDYWFEGRD